MKMKWTQITPHPINSTLIIKINPNLISIFTFIFEKNLLCLYLIFYNTAFNILYLSLVSPFLRSIYYPSLDDNHPYYLQLIYLSTLNNCRYRVYIVLLISYRSTSYNPSYYNVYIWEYKLKSSTYVWTPTMEWYSNDQD